MFSARELDRLRNVGGTMPDIDAADVKPVRKRRRIAGPIMAVVVLMLIGAALAVAWRGYGDKIRQFAEAQIAAKEIAPIGDSQSDAVLRNLEAMKQDLSQIAASQNQLDQRLSALEAHPPQAAQPGHGIPPGGSGWLDDPGALAFVTDALHRPAPAPSRPARPIGPKPATVGAGAPPQGPRPVAAPRPLPRPASAAPALPAPTPVPPVRSGPIPPEPVPGQ